MEISVVLLILVLFASMIVPNLVKMKAAQSQRAAYGQVMDLIGEARLDAINENTTYALTWDSGTSEFDLKKEPQTTVDTGSTTPQPAARPLQTATSINDFQQVKSIPLPSPLQTDGFRIGSNPSDAGSFALHFYADGTCDGGGFQITQGDNVKAISVDKFGLPTLIDGSLPDTTEILWTAGTYAQKT